VESLKLFTISKKSVLARLQVVNPELADKYFANGKSVIFVGGHYNNWELLAVAIDAQLKHHCVALYKPLTNKFFDIQMRKTRGKFGLEMVSIREARSFFENRKSELNAVIFGSDQSPGNPERAYWMKFLNQDTAVLFGAEKFAKEYNIPVLYGHINKIRRGYYTFELELITDDPKSMPYGAITEAHTRILEKDINREPQYWLWSHRRWKHKKPPTEQLTSEQV
jgi:KDO2-lipid IV(A) lauroyltransferase